MTRDQKLIADFEKAVRDHAWMGSKHPEEHRAIERQYEKARDKLMRRLSLKRLTELTEECGGYDVG